MMFKLLRPLPDKVVLACSGGTDSMAALHWLHRGKKLATVIHMNHRTGEFADEAEHLVNSVCRELKINRICGYINELPPIGESKENFWRKERYKFFMDCYKLEKMPIVTAHNLDDCVEEYVINSIVRGRHGTIPYAHGPVIRPFRTWSRDDITDYCINNKILWLEDPSNADTKYLRNRVRHEVMPKLYELNEGLHTMVRRMLETERLE